MVDQAQRLRRLAAREAVFSSPEFSIGHWDGGYRTASGAIQMPYFVYSDVVDRFHRELGELGWVYPFDWGAWAGSPRGQELLVGPAAVATATAPELANLLTTIIRSDRFSEGTIADAFERGLMTAIARRAGELARESESRE
jgi:hypothetical protein